MSTSAHKIYSLDLFFHCQVPPHPPSHLNHRSAHVRTGISDKSGFLKACYGRTFKMTNLYQFGLQLCKISECEDCFGAFFKFHFIVLYNNITVAINSI